MAERSRRATADLVLTLAAGETRIIPRRGRSYYCILVTENATVQIGLDQEPAEFLYQAMGDGLHPAEPDFEAVILYNGAATPQSIILKTSFGTLVDNRLELINGTIPTRILSPNSLRTTEDTLIAIGGTLTIPADENRRELIVVNNSTSEILRVGDAANVSDTRGDKIPSESKYILESAAAVTIRNPSTNLAAITVSILETYQA